jgi:hypothetical protein
LDRLFAYRNETAADPVHGVDDRVASEQNVAEIDRPEVSNVIVTKSSSD